MGSPLLWLVRLYWALVPEKSRRSCLFRISCSRHVYQETKAFGLYRGLSALKARYRTCRAGYQLIENPVTGERILILPGGEQLLADQMSERVLQTI